jgi:hypothetical protein
VRLMIAGDAGGSWIVRKSGLVWELGKDDSSFASATVTIDQEIAWRLFTKGIAKKEAKRLATIEGDPALAARVFETVSILA